MGCSYSISGTVTVRKCSEVDAILEELKSLCADPGLDVRDEETTRQIKIEIGDYFSWAGTRAIDETLLKLSPFCLAAARLETECEGERSELYLGGEDSRCASGRTECAGVMTSISDQRGGQGTVECPG